MMRVLSFGDFIGDTRRQVEAGDFSFAEVTDSPDVNVPRHTHEDAHFCFIAHGDYVTTIKKQDRMCGVSTMLYHPAGTTHRDHFRSANGRFFTISIKPARLKPIQEYADLLDHSVEFPDEKLSWLGSQLYRETLSMDPMSPMVMEGMALELLGYVIRRETRLDSQPPIWLKRAVERIEDGYTEPITIAEIAKAAGVHPVHLARSFQKFFRCSPAEYLRQCRIRRASTLLLKRGIPIIEIALDSGFADQTHFTRTFKRITGLTPGEFRKLFAP